VDAGSGGEGDPALFSEATPIEVVGLDSSGTATPCIEKLQLREWRERLPGEKPRRLHKMVLYVASVRIEKKRLLERKEGKASVGRGEKSP